MITNTGLHENGLIAVERLGNILRLGDVPSRALVKGAAASLNALPVSRVLSASGTIQNMLGFRVWEYGFSASKKREQALHQLASMPALAQFFTLHPNGYVRESALRAFRGVPASPSLLAMIAVRLNDWAGPVRKAALQCMKAFIEEVDPAVVVTMGIDMHGRWCDWARWSPEEAACMNELFACPVVQKQLALQFATRLDGPLPITLRHFLRQPALDTALPMLACKAQLAGVRAVALQVILWGHASWQTGTRREWINKPYGISRSVPVLAQRDVLVSADRNALIGTGLRDK